MKFRLAEPVRAALLSETLWKVLPTPATLYLNRERLREPMKAPALPSTDWSYRERHALLVTSEERLRNLEGKGPGLATVSAIIAAAVLVSITAGWNESTTLARVILGLAATYAVLSLLMPLYLVGPLKRNTIHVADLETAAQADRAEEILAESAARAAMSNDLQNLRLSNLLDAARRELSYTLALLLLWVLLVPATGLLRCDSRQGSASGKATTTSAPQALSPPETAPYVPVVRAHDHVSVGTSMIAVPATLSHPLCAAKALEGLSK